jgi:hypothetical protein
VRGDAAGRFIDTQLLQIIMRLLGAMASRDFCVWAILAAPAMD